MSEPVSHETQCSTLPPKIVAQIEQRRAGTRKQVRHGGLVCCTCLERPPRKSGRDCEECHRQAQKDYRDRLKARNQRNAIIAEGVMAAVAASENTNTSKGIDNGQTEGSGRGSAPS